MNIARLVKAAFGAAFFFALTPAVAQQANAPLDQIVIGRGTNVTGFKSLALTSGQLAIGQSSGPPQAFALSGAVTMTAGGVTSFRNFTALSVLGRSANSTGAPAEISCSAGSDAVLRESGNVLGCGTIATAGIANGAVTNAKLANAAAWTWKLNNSSGPAAPTDTTIAALTARTSPASTDLVITADPSTGQFGKSTLAQAIGSIGSGVTTFKGRNGAVVPAAGDYIFTDQTLALPRGYISGFAHSNDVGSPNTVIDIGVGIARDSTNTYNINLGSAFTKTTGSFSVGTGNGCLDTGSVANNTWYYTFVILRTDLATPIDILCSTSASAPTMPANYTYFRRIGSFKTASGSTNIVAFTQVNDRWYWTAAVRETGGAINCVTSPGLQAVTVPRVQGVVAIFNTLFFGSPTASSGIAFAPGFAPVVSTSANGYSALQNVNNLGAGGQLAIPVNSSAQISHVCDNAGAGYVFNIYTQGWVDPL